MKNSGHAIATQRVLASKFPISISMLTQGQPRCQKVRKIPKNYIPVSDFATIENTIQNQRNTFSGYILSILNICYVENNSMT